MILMGSHIWQDIGRYDSLAGNFVCLAEAANEL